MEKQKKQRALFFISSLGAGGAERICATLADELSKKYICDMIVVSGNKSVFEFPKTTNILYLDKENKNKGKIDKLVLILKNRKKINDYIRNNEKEGNYILITAHLNMGQIAAALSCKRKETMYVMHNPQKHNRGCRTWMYRTIFKYIFGNKLIGAVSEGIKNELINEYKIEEKRIVTVYNPIDLEKIYKWKEKNIEYDREYILAVGRLSEEKRFDRLLKVYSKGEFYKRYDLVILGEGEQRKKLEKLINEMKLQNYVHMDGYCENPFAWMKHARVVINTSDYEALPMSIIEALATGTGVVAAKCNYGPSELLIGEFSEYLVEPIDDIEKYINKIEAALIQYPTIDKGYVEKYSVNAIVGKYLKSYASEQGR